MSSSSSDSDLERSEPGPSKKKCKKYTNKQKVFQNGWLEDPRLKKWLRPTKNKNKCKCIICDVELQCGKSEITKHSKTAKHQKLINVIDSNIDISTFVVKETSLTKSIKRAEIGLSAFFAEHNVAFLTVDHLVPLLKVIAPDSQIINGIRMGRTKCTEIVKSVLAKKEEEDLVQILKNSFFSILLDESTDVADKKYLCLLVRYRYNGKVRTSLLELIELDARDCCAESIFTAVKNCFGSKSIPIQNVIGVASDGAAVMVGNNNSFFSRIKEAVPHAILLKCICHSSALIAGKACEELPRSPEDLIRNIATYVSGSSKRCAILSEFQEFFNCEKKKLLKLASTRWLSMYNCVKRILDNWDVLLHFFSLAVVEDHLRMASIILEMMQNPLNKGYLLFLLYTLNYFNTFNALFQSRSVLINELHSKCLTIFWQLAQNFVKPELVYKCHKSAIRHPQNYIELEKIGVGFKCGDFIKTLPTNLLKEFRLKCLNFYITSAEEMQKRLPLNDNFFKELNILTPTVALDIVNRNLLESFSSVVGHYKTFIDIEKFEYEWRLLPFSFTESKLDQLKLLEVEEFWCEISSILDENSLPKFVETMKLINILLVLPHSNAEAERIFSIVTDCKPKKRNRLGSTTLNAMAVFRSALQSRNLQCSTFPIEEKHVKLLNNTIYSFKN